MSNKQKYNSINVSKNYDESMDFGALNTQSLHVGNLAEDTKLIATGGAEIGRKTPNIEKLKHLKTSNETLADTQASGNFFSQVESP